MWSKNKKTSDLVYIEPNRRQILCWSRITTIKCELNVSITSYDRFSDPWSNVFEKCKKHVFPKLEMNFEQLWRRRKNTYVPTFWALFNGVISFFIRCANSAICEGKHFLQSGFSGVVVYGITRFWLYSSYIRAIWLSKKYQK